MAWQKISKRAIKGSLQRAGLAEAMQAWEILEKTKQYLKENFGKKIVNEVEPRYVQSSSLVLRVSSPLWSRAIKEKEIALLKYLRNPKIKRLRFIV